MKLLNFRTYLWKIESIQIKVKSQIQQSRTNITLQNIRLVYDSLKKARHLVAEV